MAGPQSSAIMASLDPVATNTDKSTAAATTQHGGSNSSSLLPDVLSTELQSLNLHADDSKLSFLLVDSKDCLTVGSETDFARMLGCADANAVKAKVVSMVGNTGEGKSYALNRALFQQHEGQEEVFSTRYILNCSSIAPVTREFGPYQAFFVNFL